MGPLREGSPVTVIAHEQTNGGVHLHQQRLTLLGSEYEGGRPVGFFAEEEVDSIAKETVPGRPHFSDLTQRREWVFYLDTSLTSPSLPDLPGPGLDYRPRSYLPQTG